jgi:hypothetical protein
VERTSGYEAISEQALWHILKQLLCFAVRFTHPTEDSFALGF